MEELQACCLVTHSLRNRYTPPCTPISTSPKQILEVQFFSYCFKHVPIWRAVTMRKNHLLCTVYSRDLTAHSPIWPCDSSTSLCARITLYIYGTVRWCYWSEVKGFWTGPPSFPRHHLLISELWILAHCILSSILLSIFSNTYINVNNTGTLRIVVHNISLEQKCISCSPAVLNRK